jgi:gliding motility-associated-like protein
LVKVYARVICLFVFLFLSFISRGLGQCSTIDFAAIDTAGCSPLIVKFQAIGAMPGSRYDWDFGTGAGFIPGADTATQVYSVASSTKYKVTLRVTNGSTVCTVSKSIIHVLQTPTPIFKVSPGNVICNPKVPITLTDSTPGEVSRIWIIDGVRDTHRVVKYFPSGVGSKSLSLQSTNKYGCSGYFIDPSYFKIFDSVSTDFCGDVVVDDNSISAQFTPRTGTIAPGRSIVAYNWSFPGGSPSSYVGKIPGAVTYNDKTKNYDVSLTITTSDGCKYTILRKGYISYFAKGNPNNVCVNATVNTAYSPAFGSETVYNTSLNLPSSGFDPMTNRHWYPIAGQFDGSVSYSFQKTGGCTHTATIKNLFTVNGPAAAFSSVDRQSCNANDTTHLKNETDTFRGGTITYTWKLYDTLGHLVKVLGPTKGRDTFYIFHKEGKYSVTLIAKSTNGCLDSSYKKNFIVINHPKADFTTANTTACVGKDMQIIGSPTPPDDPKLVSYTYDWYIQKSDSPALYYNRTGKNITLNFATAGYYDVRLILGNGPKCVDTIIKRRWLKVIGVQTDIAVGSRLGCPNPNFKTTLSTSKKYVVFPPDVSPPPTFLWTVNPFDGAVIVDPTAQTTDVYFTHGGCYDVKLVITTVVGNDTCRNVFSKLRYICAGPDNYFQLPKNGCLGDTEAIINYSDPSIKIYKWFVKPANAAKFWPSDTVGTPSIIYLRDTCMKVSLVDSKVIDGSMCSDTVTLDFCPVVPEPDFTAPSQTVYCAPTTVEFHNASKNAKTYKWDFGDGSAPLLTRSDTVAHVYTSISRPDYDVTLTAYDSNGCGNSVTKSAFINVTGPVPRFKLSTKKACNSVTVQFTNTSKNVNKYYFFYGDNTVLKGSGFDTTTLAAHSYAYDTLNLDTKDSTSFYPIALSLDDSNCRVFYRDTITLYRSPKPKFKVSKSLGCAPFRASFTDQSRFVKKWYWDFDNDGKFDDSTQNPVFTYKKAGKYSVKLIARNGVCSDSVVYKDMVEVLPVPNAVFTPSQAVVCGSAVVSFKNTSTDYVRYVFDYADGSQPDSNVMVPHKYYFDTTRFSNTDSIIYTPTLTAYNALGCATVKMDTIVVYPNPIASFTEDITSGCAPLTVHFKQNSKLAYKYYWDFNNDGIIDTSGPSAVHTFSPGFYTVKMLAKNYGGCTDSMVKVNLVSVNPVPVADFMVSDSDICVKQPVHFTDYTFPKANIRKWLWHFDEPKAAADTSTVENPQFSFLTPGYHTISLAVQDFKGCADTVVKKAIYVEDTLPPYSGRIDYVTVDDSDNIRVVWNRNNIRHFKEYRISRYDKLGGTLIDSVFSQADTSLSDEGSAINANIQSYGYSLQTINGCGYLSSQSPVHATIRLIAQPANGFSKAVLSWNPYQGWNPVKYIILRSSDHFASSQKIDSVAGDQLSYLDSNLCDEDYTYAVLAIDSSGRFYSRSNTSTAHPPYQYQLSPLRLRYATVKDNRQVLVVWEPGYQVNAHKFVLDRKTGTEDWNQNFVTISSQDSFFDDNVNVFDNSYAYRIRSLDECGYLSPNSNTGTSLLLKQKTADDKVLLRWNPYRTWANGVNKYLVQVQQRNKKFRTVATLNGADTSYADDSVYTDIDTAYCYRLIAIEKAPKPDSSMSNMVCAVLPSRVFVPNAFSPNNDGLNDIWKPSALSIYNAVGPAILNFNAKIYDRWGTRLWESGNINTGWDGTYQGRKVQVDTYIYIINADGIDGRSIHIKGNVSVIR